MLDDVLISFCNAHPGGLALGRYRFETEEFAWVQTQFDGVAFDGATGLCAHDGGYYILGQGAMGRTSLAALDRDLRLRAAVPLARVRDGHSLILDGKGLLAVSTESDEVIRLHWDGGSGIREERFWAASGSGTDTVHVNSIVMIADRPHVSCFGPRTGRSHSSASDGRVIDLTTGDAVFSGLRHPHTLFFIEDRFCVLESGTGAVLELDSRAGTINKRWQLSGYVRGAAVSGGFLYVGASAYRQKSKTTGALRPIPSGSETRCLLHRIDMASGDVQTRDLTSFGREIYDLAVSPPLPFGTTREDAMALRLSLYDSTSMEHTNELQDSLHYRIIYDAELHRLINEDRNFLTAAFALERLLARDPLNADWQYHYGFCLLSLGVTERAIVHLEKALELGYYEFWTRYNLASAYLKTGAFAAARVELARAEGIKPEGVDVSQLRAAINEFA